MMTGRQERPRRLRVRRPMLLHDPRVKTATASQLRDQMTSLWPTHRQRWSRVLAELPVLALPVLLQVHRAEQRQERLEIHESGRPRGRSAHVCLYLPFGLVLSCSLSCLLKTAETGRLSS